MALFNGTEPKLVPFFNQINVLLVVQRLQNKLYIFLFISFSLSPVFAWSLYMELENAEEHRLSDLVTT